jgi:hypothetical protein
MPYINETNTQYYYDPQQLIQYERDRQYARLVNTVQLVAAVLAIIIAIRVLLNQQK